MREIAMFAVILILNTLVLLGLLSRGSSVWRRVGLCLAGFSVVLAMTGQSFAAGLATLGACAIAVTSLSVNERKEWLEWEGED